MVLVRDIEPDKFCLSMRTSVEELEEFYQMSGLKINKSTCITKLVLIEGEIQYWKCAFNGQPPLNYFEYNMMLTWDNYDKN